MVDLLFASLDEQEEQLLRNSGLYKKIHQSSDTRYHGVYTYVDVLEVLDNVSREFTDLPIFLMYL